MHHFEEENDFKTPKQSEDDEGFSVFFVPSKSKSKSHKSQEPDY